MNQSARETSWLAMGRTPGQAPNEEPSSLQLLESPAEGSLSFSRGSDGCVLFDGVLYQRAELQRQFAAQLPPEPTDADLVAQAYGRWGADAVGRLKGIFAVIIADDAHELILCARDPVGIRPLFYTDVDRALLLSPSVEMLLRQPGVSAELNRASLVARLTKRWPVTEDTYFTHVRRVPPGHIMRVSRDDRRVYRYWNPVPAEGRMEWIPDDEAPERFEALLARAVSRCVEPGPLGIYMSGGLDSSMLAMIAAALCRTEGRASPWGLSLLFSADPHEGVVQQGLAVALGLSQLHVGAEQAAGDGGTFGAALGMTRTLPAPLTLMWRPALQCLARQAGERGCRVILAGDGADEWLWVSPNQAVDLLRTLDLGGLHQLWRIYARSYHFSAWQAFKLVVWRHGLKQLLPDTGRRAAVRFRAHGLVRRRGRSAAIRTIGSLPWIAPDPGLRSRVAQRLEESYVRGVEGPTVDGPFGAARSSLESPEKWFREEETFLVGRRTGVAVREPFWDPDLIELLVRVRPPARVADGRAKALVRRPLARRFPDLGFERQRKSNLGVAFQRVLATQTRPILEALGGLRTLTELGVVDGRQAGVVLEDALAGRSHPDRLGWAWELLNLEAWARAHR